MHICIYVYIYNTYNHIYNIYIYHTKKHKIHLYNTYLDAHIYI